ncbi:prolyl-tRNA synthetase [Parathielavia appendiculata]|uniref:proline--tRNA ligase n=1 Tax=Parathielavia appendiculata TaxID=2587402 RepID=A0AAN6U9B5_9PEZI|nr:prolyl-tRNA synthetase [Parathielavia appendiculata]
MVPPAVARLSRVWFPSGGIAVSGAEDAHSKLIRAGFLRQSNAGMFHMLPLGRRVQDKVEGLVASHMEELLGASRVSLSTISAEALWKNSGRLEKVASELFRFSDRRDVPYLLAPTHEEEITSLVARTVKSYKELPLRLYQITRKYRDELRPRHGLLRGREFIMKDLYTFDNSTQSALETYENVRAAYSKIFAALKLPVVPVKASSGDMGGDLSHEYHLPTPLGEDCVVSCADCGYSVNEEIASSPISDFVPDGISYNTSYEIWRGITKDRTKLVNVWYPKWTRTLSSQKLREHTAQDVNLSVVKSIEPDLDAGVEDALPLWAAAVAAETRTAVKVVNVIDSRLGTSFLDALTGHSPDISSWPSELNPPISSLPVSSHHEDARGVPLNLLRIRTGDKCPQCVIGSLKVDKAMELGHTFFLGTRYSEPLGAMTTIPPASHPSPMQMGCYGIGISRVIGAAAEHLADKTGLNWPIAMAPYSCVVVPGNDCDDGDAEQVYNQISSISGPGRGLVDVILDDRKRSLPWKLTDADLIGFPVLVLLGREWRTTKRVEVQCRALGLKQFVEIADLPTLVGQLHAQL